MPVERADMVGGFVATLISGEGSRLWALDLWPVWDDAWERAACGVQMTNEDGVNVAGDDGDVALTTVAPSGVAKAPEISGRSFTFAVVIACEGVDPHPVACEPLTVELI
jgi:hypothetical protein